MNKATVIAICKVVSATIIAGIGVGVFRPAIDEYFGFNKKKVEAVVPSTDIEDEEIANN